MAEIDAGEVDLDLAVELVNTVYALADPPDRLSDVTVYQRILRDAGQDDLARELAPDDLPALRELRSAITPVFATTTLDERADLLNRLLRETPTAPQLSITGEAARWTLDAGLPGIAALRARLANALAGHLIRHGATRLGVCQAAPCTCAFVDRSRARTRRFCCDQCNDRAAATAYRHRKTHA